MEDQAVVALKRLIEETDGGRAAVARTIHANEQTLYQIVSGIPLPSGRPRGVGRDLRERLTRHYPTWLDAPTLLAAEPPARYATTHSGDSKAQDVSLNPFNLPPIITWEVLMKTQDLPALFSIEMPDDAMAPRIERGTVLIFSATAQPFPGAGVLVRDRTGHLYVRRYRASLAPEWQAHAVNETAYRTLESGRDGISIIGVLQGVMSGKI